MSHPRQAELDRYSIRIEDLDNDSLARDAAICGEEGAFLMGKARIAKAELERRMTASGARILPTRDILVENVAKREYDYGDGLATYEMLTECGFPHEIIETVGTYTPETTKTVTVPALFKPSTTRLKAFLEKLPAGQRRAVEATFAVTEKPNLTFKPIDNGEMP
jgi:hypothetical protein